MSTFRGRIMTVVAASALLALVGTPLHAKDNCETVAKDIRKEVSTFFKNFQATAVDVFGSLSETDDKKKAAAQSSFCHSTGELLGLARAARSIGKTCDFGKKRIAALEEALEKMETAAKGMCTL
jgi:hypothetical protein